MIAMTACMDALAAGGKWSESIMILDQMRSKGITPNERTYKVCSLPPPVGCFLGSLMKWSEFFRGAENTDTALSFCSAGLLFVFHWWRVLHSIAACRV